MSVMALASLPVAAQSIAVLDYQMALLESDAAKRYSVDAEKKFGSQLQRLQNLEAEAKRLQERMQRDGDKLGQTELERLELEFRQKAREFETRPRSRTKKRPRLTAKSPSKPSPNLNKP